MAEKRCYYEILGVERTASREEISTAYRKLAIKFHPDKNPGDEETVKRFKECSEAFEVLGDEEKRGRYDRYGHAGVEQGGGGAGFHDVEDIFSAFGDIFGDVFGGSRGGGRRVRRGADVKCEVSIDLHEAARGCEKEVAFQRREKCDDCDGTGAAPGTILEACSYCGGKGQVIQSAGFFRMQTTCPACHGAGTTVNTPCRSCRGQGRVRRKTTRTVSIPAGVDESTRLRLEGEGEVNAQGTAPGDCYVFIHVREHPLFQRDGSHLICHVPITYSQAALGATIEVPTLDGREELEIPTGTPTGEVFRLRGRGMPNLRGGRKGDLLVQVTIEVPKKLTSEEEKLLRKLAEIEHTNVSPHRKSFFEKLKDYFVPEHDAAETEE